MGRCARVIPLHSGKGPARMRLTQCVRVRLRDVYGFADIFASIPFRIEPSDLDIAQVRRRPTRRTNRRSAPTPAAQTTTPSLRLPRSFSQHLNRIYRMPPHPYPPHPEPLP